VVRAVRLLAERAGVSLGLGCGSSSASLWPRDWAAVRATRPRRWSRPTRVGPGLVARRVGRRSRRAGSDVPFSSVVVRPYAAGGANGLNCSKVWARFILWWLAHRSGSRRPRSIGLSAGGATSDCGAARRSVAFGLVGPGGTLVAQSIGPAAARLTAWIGRLRHEFSRLDCLGHQMSGSGTSYFGLCRHARHARAIANA